MAMVTNNKLLNCPHLRFPEFKDEWTPCIIKDFGEVITGGTPSTLDSLNYNPPKYLWASPSDLGNTKYLHKTKTLISEKGLSTVRALPKGSILVTCIGLIGKMGIATEGMASNQQINAVIVSDAFSNEYVYYAIYSKAYSFQKMASTQVVPILSKREFERLPNSYPPLPEQKKIASFLSLLDERIEVQRQTIKERKALKHQCTQILFRNQDWPEFQFKDFLRLPQQEKYTPVSFDEILSVRLHCKGIERSKVTNLSLGATQYYKRYTGQLIYGKQNIHNGAIDLVKEEFNGGVTSKDIPSFEFYSTLCHPEYFKYYLQRKNYYQKLERLMSGTGSKRMHETTFLELTLPLPSLAEQKKIAELFTIFDERIEVEEALLAYYETQKRYLLRQMFV